MFVLYQDIGQIGLQDVLLKCFRSLTLRKNHNYMKHLSRLLLTCMAVALSSAPSMANLKLLSVDPADGSSKEQLKKITLRFEASGGEEDGCVRFNDAKTEDCYAENLGDGSKTDLEFDWSWGGLAYVTFASDLSAGEYKIVIATGTIYDYDDEDELNDEIVLHYTVTGGGTVDPADDIRAFPHTINPAAGDVASIDEIRISFEEDDIYCNWEYNGNGCRLTDAEGNVVYTFSGNGFNWNKNYAAAGSEFYVELLGTYYNEDYEEDDATEDADGKITYPIKEPGTYTLTFPEKFFRLDSYDDEWNMLSAFSQEMQFTWNVTGGTVASETVEVSSYDELLPYTDAVNENLTLKVMADFTVEDFIRIPGKVDLDLNGHTLTLDGKIATSGSDILTIKDLSNAKSGAIVTTVKGALLVQGESTLYVEGGNFSAEGDLAGMYALIQNGKYSSVYVKGGYFSRPNNSYAIENEGALLIQGGTFVASQGIWALVLTTSEGVTTIEDGAFYAANKTHGRCFETMSWSSEDGDSEIATLILPEGVIDGGAVVLSETWAIPGTYYINYALPENAQMLPGMHYYTPGMAFALPECNRMEGVPFAGWSKEEGVTDNLLTKVTSDMAENLQLYPIWKYKDIAEGVNIDLSPVRITPAPDSELADLSSVTMYFTEDEAMNLYINAGLAAAACVQKMNWGIAEFFCGVTLSASQDGSVTASFANPVDARGEYRLFIPAGAIGDETYNVDYKAGRCNPDIFHAFTIVSDEPSAKGYTTDPADGATVEKLETIRFLFEDGTVMYDYDIHCFITDAAGNQITIISATNCNYGEDNDVVMNLPVEITKPGTYTLTVPTGFFRYEWGEEPVATRTLSWTVGKGGNDSTTAIATMELAGVSLYPNPANGEFNVSVPVNAEVEISNAAGAVVKRMTVTEGVTRICLNNRGIYFVRFTSANRQVAVRKVIIR